MSLELIEEAKLVVDVLNDEWYEKTQDETKLPFAFIYASHWMGIEFLEQAIWDNQDYDRNLTNGDEDDDEYESIMSCVRRRVTELQELIAKFTA
jgi:hypothetical protein